MNIYQNIHINSERMTGAFIKYSHNSEGKTETFTRIFTTHNREGMPDTFTRIFTVRNREGMTESFIIIFTLITVK